MEDWLQVLLNSVFAFIFMFIVAKLLGKKQLSELTVVDYIIGITIGSIAAEWCADAVNPWYYYAIGMGVFLALSLIIDWLELKAPFKHFFKGSAIILIEDGEINYKNLKKTKLSVSDLIGLCRSKNYFDLNAVAYAIFEVNGELSVLPKAADAPTVKSDISGVKLEKATLPTYLIVDGKIKEAGLSYIGKTRAWLFHECKIESKAELGKIILAFYDEENDSVIIHKK